MSKRVKKASVLLLLPSIELAAEARNLAVFRTNCEAKVLLCALHLNLVVKVCLGDDLLQLSLSFLVKLACVCVCVCGGGEGRC